MELTRIAVVGATLCSGYAFAGLIAVDLGKNLQLTQTDAAGDMANPTDYFAARAFYQNTSDFDSATLTWPASGGPVPMTNVPGTYQFLNGQTAAGYYLQQSSSYGTQAALDAAYPMGSYEYDLFNSGDPSLNTSSTINYSTDLYPANQPTLTAASFNSLQGLNTTQAATVSFAAIEDNPDFDSTSDSDYVFLDVYTAGFGSDVYSTYSASPDGLTSLLIPANTLTPGTSYSLLLDFDNRITSVDPNTGTTQFQLFDTKTEVDFTTAAAVVTPEPAGFVLAGLGLLALACIRRYRHTTA